MIALNPQTLEIKDIYKLMIGSVVPRPIAFTSTVNETGVVNLAPFSYFNAVASDPPTVMISITYKSDGSKKDTLLNLEKNPQFVVNVVSESMAQQMNQCSADYPYGVSELEKAGFTAVPSLMVKPPRVKESLIHFECEVSQTVKIGPEKAGGTVVVFGKVVMFHVSEKVYQDGKIDIQELKPIARIGGTGYARGTDTFEIPRPKV